MVAYDVVYWMSTLLAASMAFIITNRALIYDLRSPLSISTVQHLFFVLFYFLKRDRFNELINNAKKDKGVIFLGVSSLLGAFLVAMMKGDSSESLVSLSSIVILNGPVLVDFFEFRVGKSKKVRGKVHYALSMAALVSSVLVVLLEGGLFRRGILHILKEIIMVGAFIGMIFTDNIATDKLAHFTAQDKTVIRFAMMCPMLLLLSLLEGEHVFYVIFYSVNYLFSQTVVILCSTIFLMYAIGRATFHLHEVTNGALIASVNSVTSCLVLILSTLAWRSDVSDWISWVFIVFIFGANVYTLMKEAGDSCRDDAVMVIRRKWKVRALVPAFIFAVIVVSIGGIALSNAERQVRSNVFVNQQSAVDSVPGIPWKNENVQDSQTRHHNIFHSKVIRPFGVNLIVSGNSGSGLSENGRALRLMLDYLKVPYTLVNGMSVSSPSPTGSNPDAPFFFSIESLNVHSAMKYIVKKDRDFFNGVYHIGIWAWELEAFPQVWMDRLDYYSEIWGVSKFVRNVIGSVATSPVISMPLPVLHKAGAATPEVLARFRIEHGIPPDSFLYFFTFDYHSVEERKNPKSVILAFQEAFADVPDKNVRLFLIARNGNTRKFRNQFHDLRSNIRDDRIIVSNGFRSGSHFHLMLQACDSFISLHRSEGFGLPMLQAMSYGKPVIATGYSGSMDFCETSCILVPYELRPPRGDHSLFPKESLWAEPDIALAANAMRELTEKPQMYQEYSAKSFAEAEKWSLEECSHIVYDRLTFLYKMYVEKAFDRPDVWPPFSKKGVLDIPAFPPSS
eukprot:TRINITY_DN2074_c0_g1_i1.p1 TRINITY_DN2074_c0_g1~~TRINITY_DN2074_c0_g1_i1.p1  ORF type:complete len:789 (-),score=179.40 TRINITY_DN2074_c0_g1_i1:136-2502(-)